MTDNLKLSPVCDAMRQINFSGNIIPISWFTHLRREKSGRPHTTAIMLLSEIVYWYRPTEMRDEKTGRLLGYKDKFWADKWQRSYQSLADQFGFTKRQVKDAILYLEKRGLITREFRHIRTEEGQPLSNVLFIEPIPTEIAKITYQISENISDENPSYDENPSDGSDENPSDVYLDSSLYQDSVEEEEEDSLREKNFSDKPKTNLAIVDAPEAQLLLWVLETYLYDNGNVPTHFENKMQRLKWHSAATRQHEHDLKLAIVAALDANPPVEDLRGLVRYVYKYELPL